MDWRQRSWLEFATIGKMGKHSASSSQASIVIGVSSSFLDHDRRFWRPCCLILQACNRERPISRQIKIAIGQLSLVLAWALSWSAYFNWARDRDRLPLCHSFLHLTSLGSDHDRDFSLQIEIVIGHPLISKNYSFSSSKC